MTTRITNYLLDLDGVVVDFIGGACRMYGFDPEDIPWIVGDHTFTPEMIGVELTKKEFYEGFTFGFWADLDFTPEAKTILNLMHNRNTTILTRPTAFGAGGKQAWIKKNLPRYFYKKKYLIGPDKAACAHPGALLIDDSDDMIKQFRAAGGHGILFPRIWNSNHHIKDPVLYLRACLALIDTEESDEGSFRNIDDNLLIDHIDRMHNSA